MSIQMIDGVEYSLSENFILRKGLRIVGYLEGEVAHLCSQAQGHKIRREAFWTDVARKERQHNRLLLLCQYHVHGRPDDRSRIEELAGLEGRELYPDEDAVFVRYETRAQTEERWKEAAVRRRRLATLAWVAARR